MSACSSASSSITAPTDESSLQKMTESLAKTQSDAMAKAVDSMKVGECTTSTAVIKAKPNKGKYQKSTGCAQVSIQTQLSVAINKSTQCSLSTQNSNVQSDVIQSNDMKIVLQHVSASQALALSAAQTNTNVTKVYNFSSQSVQNTMSSSIASTMQNYAKSLQSLKKAISGGKAFQANPQAQASISAQISAVENNSDQTAIAEQVAKSISKIVQNNGLSITLDGVEAQNLSLNFSQLNVNDYVIQNVTNQFVSNVFGSTVQNAVGNTAEAAQKEASSSRKSGDKAALGSGGGSTKKSGGAKKGFIFLLSLIVIGGGAGIMASAKVAPPIFSKLMPAGFAAAAFLFLLGIVLIKFHRRAFGKTFLILSIILCMEIGVGIGLAAGGGGGGGGGMAGLQMMGGGAPPPATSTTTLSVGPSLSLL